MRTLALVLVCCVALGSPVGAGAVATGRLAVVASFYPMYEFSRHVGGTRVTVRNLVPAGAEPHDFEPTPRDVIAMTEARAVVYNGVGLEPWVQRLLPTLPARVVRINASAGLPLATATSGEDRGRQDPHVWLDPVLAQRQIDNILAGLVGIDLGGRAIYQANADAYKAKLQALHAQTRRTLGACRKKVFVAAHDAFGYFAARYGLTQVAVSGLEPEAEPSAAKIREILRVVRQHNLRVIYYETLASPRVAATIARETGARTLVLNPIEGLTDEELQEGKDYISVMQENVRNLTVGLDCR
jgi:zinc transport system substrate-binding protein